MDLSTLSDRALRFARDAAAAAGDDTGEYDDELSRRSLRTGQMAYQQEKLKTDTAALPLDLENKQLGVEKSRFDVNVGKAGRLANETERVDQGWARVGQGDRRMDIQQQQDEDKQAYREAHDAAVLGYKKEVLAQRGGQFDRAFAHRQYTAKLRFEAHQIGVQIDEEQKRRTEDMKLRTASYDPAVQAQMDAKVAAETAKIQGLMGTMKAKQEFADGADQQQQVAATQPATQPAMPTSQPAGQGGGGDEAWMTNQPDQLPPAPQPQAPTSRPAATEPMGPPAPPAGVQPPASRALPQPIRSIANRRKITELKQLARRGSSAAQQALQEIGETW